MRICSKLQPPKKKKEIRFLTYEAQVDYPSMSNLPFPRLIVLISTFIPDHWLSYLAEVKGELFLHNFTGFSRKLHEAELICSCFVRRVELYSVKEAELVIEPGKDQSKHKEVKLLRWSQHQQKIQLVAWSLGTFPEKTYGNKMTGKEKNLTVIGQSLLIGYQLPYMLACTTGPSGKVLRVRIKTSDLASTV